MGGRHDQADPPQHDPPDLEVGDLLYGSRRADERGDQRAAGRARVREGQQAPGDLPLDGIPPAPRGVPQIEVKFDIDANGILGVTAIDKGSNKQADIKITGASTLSDDEVNRMVNEAEKNAAEDGKKREEVDTKNQADSMVYQTEKQLQELGDKVPAEMKTKVEGKLAELKEAVASGSMEGMKAAQGSLQQEVMAMGQSMYSRGVGLGGEQRPGPRARAAPPRRPPTTTTSSTPTSPTPSRRVSP